MTNLVLVRNRLLTALGAALVLVFCSSPDAAAFQLVDSELLGDLDGSDTTAPQADSRPFFVGEIAGGILLDVETEVYGREIWFSDGTLGGARLLSDLSIGPAWSSTFGGLAMPGGPTLLIRSSTLWGIELFRVDPVTLEVGLLRDIAPGPASSGIRALTRWQNEAWFIVCSDEIGTQLWRSDGTSAGTERALTLSSSSEGSDDECYLAATDGALFLMVDDPKRALYALATPSSEPVLIAEEHPLTTNAIDFQMIQPVGDRVYFDFDNFWSLAGKELWVSDGTPTGTSRVLDLNPGLADSNPFALAADDERLWFACERAGFGREPFVTDGTVSGTVSLGDLARGEADGISYASRGLATEQGLFFWSQAEFLAGPYFSGGTPETTIRLGEIYGASGLFGVTERFVEFGGSVYFAGSTEATGGEVFQTDGTPEGTALALDLVPGPADSSVSLQAATSLGLLCSADLGQYGIESYLLNGHPLGARSLGDLNNGFLAGDSTPGQGVTFRDRYFFNADQDNIAVGPPGGDVPFVTDGTVLGTERFDTPLLASTPRFRALLDIGERFLFAAYGQNTGEEFWSSDGTTDGTIAISDLSDDGDNLKLTEWIEHENEGYVVVDSPDRLYRASGLAGGTTLVSEFFPSGADVSIGELVSYAGDVWFSASDGGQSGRELWKTDGTPAGTVQVADVWPGPNGSNPSELTVMGSDLFFCATTPVTGTELFRCDAAGNVRLVADLREGTLGSDPQELVALNDVLVFFADDGLLSVEPYATDGTAVGTVILGDLSANVDSRGDFKAVRAGDRVFFFTRNPGLRGNLWSTAGAPATTILIADESSSGDELEVTEIYPLGSGSNVLFWSYEPALGFEPWVATAEPGLLALAADVHSGPGSSNFGPSEDFYRPKVGRAGRFIVFGANERNTGNEPHAIDLIGLGGYVAETYGMSCGDTRIGASGEARLGAAFGVTLETLPATAASLYVSSAPGSTSLVPGCQLLLGAELNYLGGATSDALGSAKLDVTIPTQPTLVGAPLFAQWAALVPGGPLLGLLELSDGLEVVIGN